MPPQALSPDSDGGRRPDLVPALRDAAEAGIRYYARLGSLAVDLAQALLPRGVELRPGAGRRPALPAGEPAPSHPEPAAQTAPTILVEAEAGQRGLGVFMVENTTGQAVSGPVSVSEFTGPPRRKARPSVTLSPDVVTLDPGDQVLVQVAALIDEALVADFRYTAEISVPTLSGARIPLVVRRQPGAAPQGAEEAPAATPPARRGRAGPRGA